MVTHDISAAECVIATENTIPKASTKHAAKKTNHAHTVLNRQQKVLRSQQKGKIQERRNSNGPEITYVGNTRYDKKCVGNTSRKPKEGEELKIPRTLTATYGALRAAANGRDFKHEPFH